MSDPGVKKIVTKGDSNVNIITTLGEIKHGVTRLTSTISHLKEFVSEIADDGIEKISLLNRFA